MLILRFQSLNSISPECEFPVWNNKHLHYDMINEMSTLTCLFRMNPMCWFDRIWYDPCNIAKKNLVKGIICEDISKIHIYYLFFWPSEFCSHTSVREGFFGTGIILYHIPFTKHLRIIALYKRVNHNGGKTWVLSTYNIWNRLNFVFC